jgi:L-alanine-DL-glutamate epimerase-like enolase superfamily enzyme
VKVTGVRTTALAVCGERRRPESRCVLELETDAGLTGIAIGSASVHDNAARIVAELLMNANPAHAPSLWDDMAKVNDRVGGSISATIATLDAALWDLKAKANREPLWRTLGGLRPRANTHARLPAAAMDDTDVTSWCESVGSQVRGAVIEASGRTDHDVQRFTIARAALGGDQALLLDARGQWTPKDAVRYIAAIERSVDLTWIESPTASADFLGHKRVADAIRGGVCAGGAFQSADQFLPHLHQHSLNIVQLDPTRLGITATLRIADAAYGFELPIALTSSIGNVNAHVASALAYCASVEVDEPIAGIESDISLLNGRLVAGDRPGNGLSVDFAAVQHSRASGA